MSNEHTGRAKKSLAAMVLAALSVMGLGGAALAQSNSTPAPAVAQTQDKATATEATEAPENEAAEAAEDSAAEEADGANEGTDDETEDPMLNSSMQAPAESDGQSEADEATALESLATITPQQARAAATAEVPGTVLEVELDNENGSVVYSVEIDNATGGHIDVKVDAGNGTVLHQDVDND